MEAIEREEELTDFVSTAKGVLQSLVEKHFPAPDRDKINRILGKISKNDYEFFTKQQLRLKMLQRLYKNVFKNFSFRYW